MPRPPRGRPAGGLDRKLARIGNLAADGRPILGLDSRDLLLVAGPGAGKTRVLTHLLARPTGTPTGSRARPRPAHRQLRLL